MRNFVHEIIDQEDADLSHAFSFLRGAKSQIINLWDAKTRKYGGSGEAGVYLVYITNSDYNDEIKGRLIINNTNWLRNYCGEAGRKFTRMMKQHTTGRGYIDTSQELYRVLKIYGYHESIEQLEADIESTISKHEYDLIRIGMTKAGTRLSGYWGGKDTTTKSLGLSPREYFRWIEMRFYPRENTSVEDVMLNAYRTRFGDPPLWNRR